jgi:phenylalanyl-tRNA synthetase beta chain
LSSGGDFLRVKGIIESVLVAIKTPLVLETNPFAHPLLESGRAVELRLAGERLGYLGEVSAAGLKQFELRRPTTVAEVRVAALEQVARLIPQSAELSPYPAVVRDFNFVVDEAVAWGAIERTLRASVGVMLEEVKYLDTYRDADRLGKGKKSLLFSLVLRGRESTLTSAEADQVSDEVLDRCQKEHGAKLRA